MPGEPSARRGRATREPIVERAAELFAERGIAATSVDEVLAVAGAGKGQFYQARQAWQQAIEILDDLRDPAAALVRARRAALASTPAWAAAAPGQAEHYRPREPDRPAHSAGLTSPAG